MNTDVTALPAGCVLCNLRRGNGPRAAWVYAEVRGPDGALLITATLEYCVRRMVESLPTFFAARNGGTP